MSQIFQYELFFFEIGKDSSFFKRKIRDAMALYLFNNVE